MTNMLRFSIFSQVLRRAQFWVVLTGGAAVLSLTFASFKFAPQVQALYGVCSAGSLSTARSRRRRGTPRVTKERIALAFQHERIFHRISETLPDILYIYDLTERCNVYVNREVGSLLGYTPAEIQAMGPRLFACLVHPDDLERVIAQAENLLGLADGETAEIEYRMQRKDGEWRWFCSRDAIYRRDAGGKPAQTLGIAQDITERKKAQEAAQWQTALLRHTTDAATLGFYVADERSNAILYHNARFLEFWNIEHLAPLLQVNAMTHTDVARHCLSLLENATGKIEEWEPSQTAPDDETAEDETRLTSGRILRRSARPIRGESGAYFGKLYLFEDVTAQRQLEEQLEVQLVNIQETNVQLEVQTQMLNQANAQLEQLATTDGLTGLQNNRAFREFLERTLGEAKRYGLPLSLTLLDVDRFKQYNDSFGHPAGDAALKQTAKILQDLCRDTDCVARYGGEEFVVVMPHTDNGGAMQMTERLRAAIEASEWSCRPVTASFGVVTLGAGHADAASLIADADRALYEAKHRGRNRAVHTSEVPLAPESM